MFSSNRGDEVLKTEVRTYQKPQVTFGRAGIEMFDNSYEFKEVKIDNSPVTEGAVMTGGWTVGQGTLTPVANRWNYILLGDPSAYDYTFSADIRRTKGSGQVQFRVRDNGLFGERNDYIGLTIGSGVVEFYRQAGGVRDTLRTPVLYPFQSNRWYNVKIACKGEQIGGSYDYTEGDQYDSARREDGVEPARRQCQKYGGNYSAHRRSRSA